MGQGVWGVGVKSRACTTFGHIVVAYKRGVCVWARVRACAYVCVCVHVSVCLHLAHSLARALVRLLVHARALSRSLVAWLSEQHARKESVRRLKPPPRFAP